MKRVKLTVAYDGTNYCGWQVQPNGITVQEALNQCLSEFSGENIETIGASRTDAGVHALGNVAVFDTEMRMPGDKFSFALNQRLPEDIRIQKSEEVDANFHPRYVKSQKTYEYRILNCRFPIPTERFYSHFTYIPLDVDKMKEAASYLIGEHDFVSFCNIRTNVEDTVRTVTDLTIMQNGEDITIHITGNGFLYNMVRIIAGTLIRVGRGFYTPDKVKAILEEKERTAAGVTAPANGLVLVEVKYGEENLL